MSRASKSASKQEIRHDPESELQTSKILSLRAVNKERKVEKTKTTLIRSVKQNLFLFTMFLLFIRTTSRCCTIKKPIPACLIGKHSLQEYLQSDQGDKRDESPGYPTTLDAHSSSPELDSEAPLRWERSPSRTRVSRTVVEASLRSFARSPPSPLLFLRASTQQEDAWFGTSAPRSRRRPKLSRTFEPE